MSLPGGVADDDRFLEIEHGIQNLGITDDTHFRGIPIADLTSRRQIPWTHADAKIFNAHLARYKLSRANCGTFKIDELLESLGATRTPAMRAAVLPKVRSSALYRLDTLALKGHVSLGKESSCPPVWKPWTRAWALPGWDGELRAEVVDVHPSNTDAYHPPSVDVDMTDDDWSLHSQQSDTTIVMPQDVQPPFGHTRHGDGVGHASLDSRMDDEVSQAWPNDFGHVPTPSRRARTMPAHATMTGALPAEPPSSIPSRPNPHTPRHERVYSSQGPPTPSLPVVGRTPPSKAIDRRIYERFAMSIPPRQSDVPLPKTPTAAATGARILPPGYFYPRPISPVATPSRMQTSNTRVQLAASQPSIDDDGELIDQFAPKTPTRRLRFNLGSRAPSATLPREANETVFEALRASTESLRQHFSQLIDLYQVDSETRVRVLVDGERVDRRGLRFDVLRLQEMIAREERVLAGRLASLDATSRLSYSLRRPLMPWLLSPSSWWVLSDEL